MTLRTQSEEGEVFVAALATIRTVTKTRGKNEKIVALRKGDSPELREILTWTYDRFRTYRIHNVQAPEVCSEETPAEVMEDLRTLLNELASHTVGSNDAKRYIKTLLSSCTKEDAQVIANIINKDLRAGIDALTVNYAFPRLLPSFALQSAKALDSWDRIQFPVIVDEKMDGIRFVSVYDGDTTKCFSKNGFEFETGMDAIQQEISKLLPGIPNVFDGELRAYRFNPKDAVCVKNKDGNWGFEYAKAITRRKNVNPEEIRKFFKVYIWDVVDLEYFQTQGRSGFCLPVENRKMYLLGLFERHKIPFKNIEILPNFIMGSREEIQEYMRELKAGRKEGCMIKPLGKLYTFAKNWNVIKLKHFVEGDFRIIGAYEGTGKYEGMLGGFTVAIDGMELVANVGTGIRDDDRLELWVEFLAGRLLGKIVEIQLKDVTPDGSLQLPSLLRFREDKDTTDTYEEIMEKLAGQTKDDD